MSAPQKRTATEIWQAIEDIEENDAAEREMERIAALSDEDVDRELMRAGIDPDVVHARGEEIARQVARKLAEAPAPRPRSGNRRTAVVLLAAAASLVLVAMLGGGGAAIARWFRPTVPQIGPDVPGPEELAQQRAREHAHELRGKAHDDCANELWVPCLKALDAARALDPAGDADPEAQEDRRAATDSLTPTPDDMRHEKPEMPRVHPGGATRPDPGK